MNNLLRHMPLYYRKSNVLRDIFNAISPELELFDKKIENTLFQFYISKADTALSRYENEYGIKVEELKKIEYRRNVIISKLRGLGTTTIEAIKNISRTYTNGEVDVIEDFENGHFTIFFKSILGIPPNIDDLYNSIHQIKPAHLSFGFKYSYLTWNDFDEYNYTFDEWDNKNITWDELEVYKKKGAI